MVQLGIMFALLIALGGWSIFMHGLGEDSMDAHWREKQVQSKEDRIHSINTLKDSLRSLSMDMADKVDELNQKSLEDKQHAQLAKDNLMDGIMSGRIKLHLPTQTRPDNGSDCGGRTAEGDRPEGTGGAVTTSTSELHPETSAALFGITEDANALAEDYNDLVDYTNIVLEKCDAKR